MWIFRYYSRVKACSEIFKIIFALEPVCNFRLFLFVAYRNKKETKSYIEISESLGVDDPSQILFVTDVYQEATAAKAAGTIAILLCCLHEVTCMD